MVKRQALINKIKILCANVYYQPPESVKLKYPCVIVKKNPGDMKPADNIKYIYSPSYTLTVIDRDPDRALAEQIFMSFMISRYDQNFVRDNLYHDIITVYF